MSRKFNISKHETFQTLGMRAYSQLLGRCLEQRKSEYFISTKEKMMNQPAYVTYTKNYTRLVTNSHKCYILETVL